MPELSLLTASQGTLIVALASAVNILTSFAKPMIEALIPDDNAQHDAIIRLVVLLLSEVASFGAAFAQGALTGPSAFGYALGGVIIATGAIAAFHLTSGVTSSSAPAADPAAIVAAAVQQLVPPAGVLPPASPAPVPAVNAVTSSAASVSGSLAPSAPVASADASASA